TRTIHQPWNTPGVTIAGASGRCISTATNRLASQHAHAVSRATRPWSSQARSPWTHGRSPDSVSRGLLSGPGESTHGEIPLNQASKRASAESEARRQGGAQEGAAGEIRQRRGL